MDPIAHIHIIASGANNHNTVDKAIRKLTIDKAIIIVDKKVYGDPNASKHYPPIRESIEKVESMVKGIDVKFELKFIDDISLNQIRDAVLEIVNENPGAKLYFNVSGGTKVLSNGLFMMAIWLEGEVYFVGEDEKLQVLTIPRVPMEAIKKNCNYITILDLLSKSRGMQKLKKDILADMAELYVPNSTDGEKAKRVLPDGTLSKWADELDRWGLITIGNPEGNRKNKLYKLTEDGLFTLKFIQATTKQSK